MSNRLGKRGWAALLVAGLGIGLGSFEPADADSPKPTAAKQDAKQPAPKPKPGQVVYDQPEPVPLTEAARRMTLPKGFSATLCAGEPEVRQPIAMAFDDRGRLWIAECYSYPKWQEKGNDRILIFEDTNGDGRFERRKVFWDQANYLTGVLPGFGGVWVCSSPHLLFIPDRNGDDLPDGPPQVILDGWSNKGVHNVLNGLVWGPDGWLYGCNGITAPSKVGKPGTPDDKRLDINCGIWRYHPTREVLEVVCHGTTNPWGLDFNDWGEAFFTNCVIGHLWHMIPGGHYKRMFGNDYNPHVYELIDACSDHLHWGGGEWTTSRGGKGIHSAPGGGHAHSGAMVYLGDSWPDEYRNSLFVCNIHGNRVNHDLIERRGSGYVGKHAPDFLLANDEWFRGINLTYGPDGSVYVIDWSDTGECHEKDAHGAHHDSGRIYKIAYGRPRPIGDLNLARLSSDELVKLQLHRNDWHVRQARRLLQERAAAGQSMLAAHVALHAMFEQQTDVTRKLRALWALSCTGGVNEEFLRKQLDHESEHIRAWAIRLLTDEKPPSDAAVAKFVAMAGSEQPSLVRLYLASALQRIPMDRRWELATALAAREENGKDQNLPLVIWYGIEPLVPTDKARAARLLVACKIPQLRQFISRRLTVK
jgi:putative membrane-bound dehydrogenase-like protein